MWGFISQWKKHLFPFSHLPFQYHLYFPFQPKHTQLKRIWSILSQATGPASKMFLKKSKPRLTPRKNTEKQQIHTIIADLEFYVQTFFDFPRWNVWAGNQLVLHTYTRQPPQNITSAGTIQHPFIITSSKLLINRVSIVRNQKHTMKDLKELWQNPHSQDKIPAPATFICLRIIPSNAGDCTKFLPWSCETSVVFNTKKLQRNMKPTLYSTLSSPVCISEQDNH